MKTELNIDIPVPNILSYSYVFPPNSTICMWPGASINVLPGCGLKLDRTVVKAKDCQNLWSDITVMGGARLTVNDFSVIQDGHWGIVPLNGSQMETSNTTYNKNFISITVPHEPGASYSGGKFSISANWFTDNGGLLPVSTFASLPYVNAPTPGPVPWAGIYTQHNGIMFVGEGNVFEKTTNGIVFDGQGTFKGASLIVTRAKFIDLTKSSPGSSAYAGFKAGYGIYMRGASRLGVSGFGKNGSPVFDNCDVGIHRDGNTGWLSVGETRMSNIKKRGIEVYNSPSYAAVSLRWNNIGSALDGIYLSNSSFGNGSSSTSNFQVFDNDVVAGKNGNGIILSDVNISPGNIPATNLEANVIEIDGGTTGMTGGIVMRNASGVLAKSNEVTILSPLTATGIRLENCSDNILNCNTITGAGNLPDQIGIMAENSQTNRFSCNTTSAVGLGVEFLGNCEMANRFRGNTMSSTTTGLQYANLGGVAAQTGVQIWRRNLWESGGSPGATHSNPAIAPQSRYFIETTAPNNHWPLNPIPGLGQWFTDQDPSLLGYPDPPNPFMCPSDLSACAVDEDGFGGGPCEDVLLKTAIANKTIDGGDYQAGMEWINERYLYRNIKEDCTDLMQQSLFQNFHNNNVNTSIGLYYEAEKGIRDLFVLDGSTQLSLEGLDAQMTVVLDSLVAVETALLAADEAQMPGLLAQKDSLLLVMESLSSGYTTLLDSVQQVKVSEANQLALDNDGLPATQSFEVNEKTVNGLFLSAFIAGDMEFNPVQLNQLQAIADQCPYDGGLAVFKARGLLGLTNFSFYDDKVLCQSTAEEQEQEEIKIENFISEIFLFPNPTKESVSIIFKGHDKKGYIKVRDLLGREVFRGAVEKNASMLSVNVQDWNEGLYFATLSFEGKAGITKPFVISKN